MNTQAKASRHLIWQLFLGYNTKDKATTYGQNELIKLFENIARQRTVSTEKKSIHGMGKHIYKSISDKGYIYSIPKTQQQKTKQFKTGQRSEQTIH